jgi:protoheme IX farnesyltransferase
MNSSIPDRLGFLRVLAELSKVRITAFVTLTTAMGYLLFARRFESGLILAAAGMFLLACGSAALNQWQEADIDARMERTRRRPIPAGHINPTAALFLAVLLMLVGLFVLTSIGQQSETLLVLSGLAVIWYNGLYTYLKRWSAFAAVPGAIIGAIPPVVGYAAAGGAPTDERILLAAMFMFIWQVPHFWLLLLMVGDQYEKAGLPTLTQLFTSAQVRRITFMWVLAAAAAGAILPALPSGLVGLPWNLLMVIVSVWLAIKATVLLFPPPEESMPFRRIFLQINVFALTMVVCLAASAVLWGR